MTLLDRAAPAPGRLYDVVAERSAAVVIAHYSSSFGMASRLLGGSVRGRVRNVYALVRIADEVVDDPSRGGVAERASELEQLRLETLRALEEGHSSNLVVHAFATTARRCGIDAGLVDPFFDSMRTDLEVKVHDRASFERYVYGSAEVVGLMCLRVFLEGSGPAAARDYERLAPGARHLGAAFQKLNFLRDLAEDYDTRGRCYFPDLDVERFCDADRDRLLDEIAVHLDAAAVAIPDLPASSRRAVRAAHATFTELGARLRVTPAADIRRTRVRVPDPVKLRLLAGALHGGRA
jgi:phytoene/squalene synthetase